MKTTHLFFIEDSKESNRIPSESIDLVVTSPPYPMIKMWDDLFSEQDSKIRKAMDRQDGLLSFELMNQMLDRVWSKVYRSLKFGGCVCINIGDAVRTINGSFMLYPNHARVLSGMISTGFTPLPAIIWRKQTNAPNKFMGSGTLPAGAYVTLEHEYILIFRKGEKRTFDSEAKKTGRRNSAIFWEERNNWFSDVWMDLKGTVQKLEDKKARERSAAFPFEVPYRLISMFSAKGDTVLDPFLGIGTTLLAAAAAGRNSIGFELDENVEDIILSRMKTAVAFSNSKIHDRLKNHIEFIENRLKAGKPMKHTNQHYGFPVITAQERELLLNNLISLKKTDCRSFEVDYSDDPQVEFIWDSSACTAVRNQKADEKKYSPKKALHKQVQLSLL